MSTKKDRFSQSDKNYMNIALRLAMLKHGLTGTNPAVGCVIVKNNKIISIGSTGLNGKPHAERSAINNSTESLKNSKLYVTLEPCSHYGKTPPCTNIIIKKKIKEVIYGIEDIDKKVKGKTKKILNKSNIVVKNNLLSENIKDFYKPYFINRSKKIPYVTGKIAKTKNNLIYSDHYKKITNLKTDKLMHYLRYKNDTILISSKTLNTDNPKLDCRLKGYENYSPSRAILDKNLDINQNSYIFKSAKKNKTFIFFNSNDKKKIDILKRNKFHLIKIKLDKNKNLDLKLILQKLYKNGCRNLLVEGGNRLTNSFLKGRLFHKFYLIDNQKNIKIKDNYVLFKNFSTKLKNFKYKFDLTNQGDKDKIILYKN